MDIPDDGVEDAGDGHLREARAAIVAGTTWGSPAQAKRGLSGREHPAGGTVPTLLVAD
jgi:hypothetical protein